jgi:hypothetical protein
MESYPNFILAIFMEAYPNLLGIKRLGCWLVGLWN